LRWKSGGRACTNGRACERSGVPPLHHPGPRARPPQSHAPTTADSSPCHRGHMQKPPMTRPPATHSVFVACQSPSLSSAVTTQASKAILRRPASSRRCAKAPKSTGKQAKPVTVPSNAALSPTAHHTPRPGSATPAHTGIAVSGKLRLEIISGI
jgi:hypothetical protein